MKRLFAVPERLNFWSDLHFGHKLMAQHRGFGDDIEAHDKHIIQLAKENVTNDDWLIILGDVSMCGTTYTLDMLRQLPGRKVLVMGNHDEQHTNVVLGEFAEVHDLLTVKVTDKTAIQRIVLCHYALLTWPQQHYGAWHLHGHSHGSLQYPHPKAMVADVGVDALGKNGPVSYAEVKALMEQRKIVPVELP